MEEAASVVKHLDTNGGYVGKIGLARPLNEMGVALLWHHDTDINTSYGGSLQRHQDGLVGEEIRCLDVDVAMCPHDYAEQSLHDLWEWGDGGAGNYLCHTVVYATAVQGRIVFPIADKGTVNEIPIDEECPLQTIDSTTLKPDHGVAPMTQSPTLHIAQGDIHAANVAYAPVNDHYLAVVAIVDLAREGTETDRHERPRLDALLTHSLEEGAFDFPTTHIVIDKTHLNALACLVDEHIGNEISQGIVLKDVEIHVNALTCRANDLQEVGEERLTIGENLHTVVLERQAEVLIDEQIDGRPMLVCHLQIALLDKLKHRPFSKLIEAALAHEPLATGVEPEEEIEEQANDRHKIDDQHPSHCLGRLPIVHQDVNHRHNLDQLIRNDYSNIHSVQKGTAKLLSTHFLNHLHQLLAYGIGFLHGGSLAIDTDDWLGVGFAEMHPLVGKINLHSINIGNLLIGVHFLHA